MKTSVGTFKRVVKNRKAKVFLRVSGLFFKGFILSSYLLVLVLLFCCCWCHDSQQQRKATGKLFSSLTRLCGATHRLTETSETLNSSGFCSFELSFKCI